MTRLERMIAELCPKGVEYKRLKDVCLSCLDCYNLHSSY